MLNPAEAELPIDRPLYSPVEPGARARHDLGDGDRAVMAINVGPPLFEEILRRHLPLAGAEIGNDDLLADLGLDSMAVVVLLVDIEDTFEVEFPDDLLSVEVFATPSTLWSAIAGLETVS
jgi:acyl carrier protein